MYRVLRPGGRSAIHYVTMGNGGELQVPVMWAERPEIGSFLMPEDRRGMLKVAGFRLLRWIDTTEAHSRRGSTGGPPRVQVLVLHRLNGRSRLP
jgi:sarcosine/dimethylglycine N-methyltransferase